MFGRRVHTNADSGNHICGLYFCSQGLKRTYLPQVELVSETLINPVCFTTNLSQTFRNPNQDVLPQVRYAFPLFDGVAVSSYSIQYGGKTLKGIVKQKDVAKQDYQAAVDRGETAGLLESLPVGVFGVTLGNVPANADIVVDITYCGELKHDAGIDGLRYMLPTSVAPRYGDYPGEVAQSNAIAKKGITIRVEMDMASSAIRRVQSPSHPIAVSMGDLLDDNGEPSTTGDFNPSQAAATLTLGTTELGSDFVLQLLIDDISKPQAIVESHPTIPNQRAVMATLVPKFTLEPAHPEIVFIADQSGSMGGTKNTALVSALKVFLKSLPLGVRFNICAFGNNFKFLWPTSEAYNESNLNAAISFVNGFNASYGGTEILKPITAAFEQRLKDLPLEVMLLTDGEVWGETSVFDYINEQIRDKSVDARVFALGIGNDVSHTLVEGVARAGNGFAQFVTQNEDTDQKVVRMLKGALYAHTKDYELEVHYTEEKREEITDDDGYEIVEKVNECLSITDEPPAAPPAPKSAPKSFFDASTQPDQAPEQPADRYAHLPKIDTPKLLQAPSEIPPLFPFNRTTVYLLLGPEAVQKPIASVTLRAKSAQGPLELNIPVQQGGMDNQGSIHHLAARKAIQDLEQGRGWIQAAKLADGTLVKTKHESRYDELVEREGVRLGERFQVASKWTSFVAIEDNNASGMGEDMEVDAGRVEKTQPGAKRLKKKRMMKGSSFPPLADEEDPVTERYVVPVPVVSCVSGAVAFSNPGQPGHDNRLFAESGSSPAKGTGLFGQAQARQSSSGGLLGASVHTSNGLFGSAPAQGTAFENHNRTGFGCAARQPQGSSLFGSSNAMSGSLFGSSAKSGYAGGLFGNSSSTAGGLFEGAPAQGNSCSLFGGSTTQAHPLFGSVSVPIVNSYGLFGKSQSTSGGLFGNTMPGFTPKDIASSIKHPGGLFSNTQTVSPFGATGNPFQPGSLFGPGGIFDPYRKDSGSDTASATCVHPATQHPTTQTSYGSTTTDPVDITQSAACFGASTTSKTTQGITTSATRGCGTHKWADRSTKAAAPTSMPATYASTGSQTSEALEHVLSSVTATPAISPTMPSTSERSALTWNQRKIMLLEYHSSNFSSIAHQTEKAQSLLRRYISELRNTSEEPVLQEIDVQMDLLYLSNGLQSSIGWTKKEVLSPGSWYPAIEPSSESKGASGAQKQDIQDSQLQSVLYQQQNKGQLPRAGPGQECVHSLVLSDVAESARQGLLNLPEHVGTAATSTFQADIAPGSGMGALEEYQRPVAPLMEQNQRRLLTAQSGNDNTDSSKTPIAEYTTEHERPNLQPHGRHALQDYQVQLMLYEQQMKQRILKARRDEAEMSNAIPLSVADTIEQEQERPNLPNPCEDSSSRLEELQQPRFAKPEVAATQIPHPSAQPGAALPTMHEQTSQLTHGAFLQTVPSWESAEAKVQTMQAPERSTQSAEQNAIDFQSTRAVRSKQTSVNRWERRLQQRCEAGQHLTGKSRGRLPELVPVAATTTQKQPVDLPSTLPDYQMQQLYLLERQNKERLLMARKELDNVGYQTPHANESTAEQMHIVPSSDEVQDYQAKLKVLEDRSIYHSSMARTGRRKMADRFNWGWSDQSTVPDERHSDSGSEGSTDAPEERTRPTANTTAPQARATAGTTAGQMDFPIGPAAAPRAQPQPPLVDVDSQPSQQSASATPPAMKQFRQRQRQPPSTASRGGQFFSSPVPPPPPGNSYGNSNSYTSASYIPTAASFASVPPPPARAPAGLAPAPMARKAAPTSLEQIDYSDEDEDMDDEATSQGKFFREEEAEESDEDMGFGLMDDETPSTVHKFVSTGRDKAGDDGLYDCDGAAASGPSDKEKVDKTMHALIALQTFSGAWTWNEELFRTLQVDANKVDRAAITSDANTNVCATALALAWLKLKAGRWRQKMVWEMIEDKAMGWLLSTSSVGSSPQETRAAVQRAKDVLRTLIAVDQSDEDMGF
ncbi:hypothetical protein LTR09_003702 [Extremus antarcticus]|uniref:von Willebrand factor type A domain-containing protein n=1 Tax=Extremus antarcticus TaxID=702011 RepID=A0AAJ0DJL6_9PEZI|nr:hypothetical protein LTR09_003702 [Extremus antarcticus]